MTQRLVPLRGRPGVDVDENGAWGRLDDVVEWRADELRRRGRAHRPAVEAGGASLSYVALDVDATRLARHLRRRRLGAGDRIAVLLDRTDAALTAQLAIARIGAAWVPLDADLPDTALVAVLHACGVGTVVTHADRARRLGDADVDAVYLDRVAAHVAGEDAGRLTAGERGMVASSPAYLVAHAEGGHGARTSGVRAPAITHDAVVGAVRTLGALFGLSTADRVHHDPRTGSDRSVPEAWVPWSCEARRCRATWSPASPATAGCWSGATTTTSGRRGPRRSAPVTAGPSSGTAAARASTSPGTPTVGCGPGSNVEPWSAIPSTGVRAGSTRWPSSASGPSTPRSASTSSSRAVPTACPSPRASATASPSARTS